MFQKKRAFFFQVLGLVLWGFQGLAQAPEQDCFNAIFVCTNSYNQPNAYSGVGSVSELPLGAGCLTSESNSVWYRFTANTSGTLTFQINPNNANDDYDFAVYDLTTDSCDGIVSGTNLPVRCNYSSTAGSTGLSGAGTNPTEPSNGPNQCTPLDVNAGETYVLLVNNFTNTPNGYSLDFGGSASIADPDPPAVDLITFSGGACNPNRIILTFNENIQCSSIASDYSDFTITGPENLVINQVLGLDCNNGSLTDQVRLRFTDYIMTPGTYTVTINPGTDGNSLLDLCGNEIPAGTSYTFEVENVGPIATIDSYTDSDCSVANGSATAGVSNGTPPYTYNWNSTPAQTTQTATGLGLGTYRVTVTDANGCTSRAVVNIGNIGAPDLSISSITDVSCNGGSDGEATAVASSGSSPYNYVWSTTPQQTGTTISGVTAGTYTVTVTDANGCQAFEEADVDEPDEISGNISVVSASCGVDDGSATVVASGGTAPYAYSWSTNPPQTGQTISNVFAGVYDVLITDANSCTATETAIVVSVVTPNAFIDTTIPSCGGPTASVTVGVDGGNGPHTFSWSTDPVQTAPTAVNLYPGSYYVQITDANSCVQILNVKVDSILPPQISIDTLVQPACGQADGTITVSTAFGQGPYNYEWSNYETGASIQNLPEGNYQVVVVDDIGCSDTLDVLLEQLPPVTQITATVVCEGFPTEFAFTTDADPSSWLWDFGDGTTSTDSLPTHVFDSGGVHNVALILLGGCEDDTINQSVEVFNNPVPSFTTDPEVVGTRTSVNFIYTGDPAVTYLWDFGNGSLDSSESPATIFPDSGQYVITLGVTDANGCSNTVQQIVDVINEPSIYLPNAFVPEGFTQSYLIKGTGVTEIDFKIFSRWGNIVYESTDINEVMTVGWDGRLKGNFVPQGVYGYVVNTTFVNGNQFSRTGTIVVIR